jgi:catechol 2,3-dioxygenase-like lactoylglutathione lyase family enzyme
MFNFPVPKLGDVTAVTMTSPDLDQSFQYYRRLGFSKVLEYDFPFPFIQISDGALLIMLRKDSNPYIALTYYVKEMDRVVAELQQAGISLKPMPTADKMIQRFLISTDEGHYISLVTFVDGFAQPPGPTMLTMSPQDYSNPEKYVNKACGMFGEYAFPVLDLERSILFWEKLGYQSLSKRSSPYPWAILSDGLGIVGLHQTNSFSEPTITFFATDSKHKIEKLKQSGLTNFTDQSESNIVLTTPEQQKINLYRLGM